VYGLLTETMLSSDFTLANCGKIALAYDHREQSSSCIRGAASFANENHFTWDLTALYWQEMLSIKMLQSLAHIITFLKAKLLVYM